MANRLELAQEFGKVTRVSYLRPIQLRDEGLDFSHDLNIWISVTYSANLLSPEVL